MRLIDADALERRVYTGWLNGELSNSEWVDFRQWMKDAPTFETAPRWRMVEDGLPKKAGEYIVAYHPCYWEDVDASVTKVGIDNFRGKSAWAKKKFQRVTHWMEKPKPPKEVQ